MVGPRVGVIGRTGKGSESGDVDGRGKKEGREDCGCREVDIDVS